MPVNWMPQQQMPQGLGFGGRMPFQLPKPQPGQGGVVMPQPRPMGPISGRPPMDPGMTIGPLGPMQPPGGPQMGRPPMDTGMQIGPMGGMPARSPFPPGYAGPGMPVGPMGGAVPVPPGGGRGGFVPPPRPMGPGVQGGGLQGTGGEEGIQRMPTPGGTRQAPQTPSRPDRDRPRPGGRLEGLMASGQVSPRAAENAKRRFALKRGRRRRRGGGGGGGEGGRY